MQTLLGHAMVLGLALGLGGAMPSLASYPDRPVTIVVPGAPGGGGDFTARLLAEGLAAQLGQSVVVENRAGASGNIAAQYVARSQPDGYTLLLAYSGTHVVNPVLFDNLQWDPIKSFAPVAMVITAPQVIAVNNNLPARNLAELIDYARQHPGQINYASSGVGSMQHIGTELLALRTGVQLTHVPYKGAGAAMTDLLSSQVGLLVTTPPAVVGYLRAGQLRALAIASKQRHPMLPDVPTTAEAGVQDVELDAWFALYAPHGTAQEAIDRLAQAVRSVTEGANFKQRSEQAGTYATYMPPAELGEFTRRQLDYWADAIGRAGIKAE